MSNRYKRYNTLQRYNGDIPVEPSIFIKGDTIEGYYYNLNECESLRGYYYIRYYFSQRPTSYNNNATAITITYEDNSKLIIKYGDINFSGDLLIIKKKDELLIKNIFFWWDTYYLKYLDLTHIGKCIKNGTNTSYIENYNYNYLGETINLYNTIYFSSGNPILIDLSQLDMNNIDTKLVNGAFSQLNGTYYIKCTQELKTYLLNNAERLVLSTAMVEDESYFIVV